MIDFKKNFAEKIAVQTNLDVEELKTYIEVPPNSELGDFAFPCFKLAKNLKKAPPVIANELKEKFELDNIVEKINVAGGYLNFYINKKTLAEAVLKEIDTKKENYGSENLGEGKVVVIDYSSPNIAKPFHIGHLRTTVIGGALYKIYNFMGYKSVGINFLGDWGIQFGKVMAGYDMWKNEYDFSKSEIDSILKIYVRFSKEEKENLELTDLAKKYFKRLEDGDQDLRKIWEWLRKISLENYEKTYNLLNCKFDSYNGEAYYNDKMNAVIDELKTKKLLIKSEGAQVVKLDEFNMPPCILITSAGTTIYATRDLAALKDRIINYDFAKALYVVAEDQQLHFSQVFKVLELMGYEKYAKNCKHIPFGLVVDKNGEKIGSRKGNSVSLEDILQESIEKVRKIIEEKNPDIKDKENVARKIGVGAIIFNDLSNSRVKDEIFDWDTILNFNGETGPYIQYIYVRTNSIINKIDRFPNIEEIDFNQLVDKESQNVLKLLYNFSEVLTNSIEKDEPSILARYLIDLAQGYSNFYANNKVICDNKSIQDARVYLTYAVGSVLKKGGELLGIEMPSEM